MSDAASLIEQVRVEISKAKNKIADLRTEAESICDDAEELLGTLNNKLDKLEGPPPSEAFLDCHFYVQVQDLADALYDGTLSSRSINGSGSRTDARVQAELMLAACGILK